MPVDVDAGQGDPLPDYLDAVGEARARSALSDRLRSDNAVAFGNRFPLAWPGRAL